METMRLTNEDRRLVREYIEEYVKHPLYPIRGRALQRTKRWAHGESMSDIAEDEGVNPVSVSQSVRNLALKVLEMAKSYES